LLHTSNEIFKSSYAENTDLFTDPKLAEVISYLKREFPDFQITQAEGQGAETVFKLESAGRVHVLRLRREFLESAVIEDIHELLAGFRLAPTLRDIGEFPIVVSANGCIFG